MSGVLSTLRTIERTFSRYRSPITGYSGGKDGLVLQHLVEQVRPGTVGYCEASFYFADQLNDIERTIERFGFQIRIRDRLDYRWLARHPSHLFADDNAIRQRDAQLRQQRGVQLAAHEGRHDLIVWGRRRGENTVRAELYDTREGPQFHPLREWTLDDVWTYIRDAMKTERPWIYRTPFGPLSGNAAFYSFRARDVGDPAACWSLVDSLDPTIRPRYERAVEAA